MKVKVIGLIGLKDCGKTQTLKMLTHKFNERKAIIVRHEYKKDFDFRIKEDNRYVIIYKDKRICVCTYGDTTEDIDDNIELFKDNKDFPKENQTCIAISAVRIYPKRVEVTENHKLKYTGDLCKKSKYRIEALEKFAKDNGTEVIWFEKTKASHHEKESEEASNEKMCDEIMKKIDELIDEM